MSNLFEPVLRSMLIGIGATAVMDVWLLLLKRFGVPALNYALLGRWVGHVFRGRWFHASMAKAEPVKSELLIGWSSHYAIGIGFSGMLVTVFGPSWTRNPTPVAAIITGIVTAAAPLLIMQPAMGLGIASSKTATPLRNSFRSVINHTVFGCGLYLAALAVQRWN